MASIYIGSFPPREDNQYHDIDYSCTDGRVREFVWNGKLIYEENAIAEPGWQAKLVDVVMQNNLHIDNGRGLHAFVYKMIDDGLLPDWNPND